MEGQDFAMLIVGALLLALVGYGIYDAQHDIHGACSDFETTQLQHVPVRCYDELKINKGCFQIESHMVGKTITYSVIPLCN